MAEYLFLFHVHIFPESKTWLDYFYRGGTKKIENKRTKKKNSPLFGHVGHCIYRGAGLHELDMMHEHDANQALISMVECMQIELVGDCMYIELMVDCMQIELINECMYVEFIAECMYIDLMVDCMHIELNACRYI